MRESERISVLKGVGEKTEQLFIKAGVHTIGDLLAYYPRTYDIYEDPISIGEIQEGKTVTVTGAIFGRIQVRQNTKIQITTLYLKDMTGTLKVIWFRMPFLRNTLGRGGVITLRGRIVRKKDALVMEHPEIFYPSASYEEKRNTMQPVYALTAGLTNNAVKKAVAQALEQVEGIRELLPEELICRYHLLDRRTAMEGIHFPETKEEFYEARKRFVFEEFLIFVLSLRMIKEREDRAKNHYGFCDQPKVDEFLYALPYELTGAQKKVWQEILRDISGESVMSRLVQGDVGSGKTIVALLALMYTGLNGYQSAMMAPTEVLARQHYENISGMLEAYGIPLKTELLTGSMTAKQHYETFQKLCEQFGLRFPVILLTGSMTAKQKRSAYERLELYENALIVGTHALIQEKPTYANLALVITDEQHRFGVKQRETLAGKGVLPHILVMSATPIPRTLAIILYGDLDISVIDELPKNRLPIKNCVVDTGYRNTAYTFMKKQVQSGRQCYVICPMVEESEALEAENVTDYSQMLQDIMGESVKVGCLHGKMKQAQKDEIMEAFGKNEIQILVSTTVIEVGIDVPNATVMMIENAERFGLAQLHQLRGRVGRGGHQSYCIFMSPSKSKETKERLGILNQSNDGFFIAGEDLRLRGPGDLFGIRQSGLMDFRLGDVFQDAKILQRANEAADWILKNGKGLEEEACRNLKEHIQHSVQKSAIENTL